MRAPLEKLPNRCGLVFELDDIVWRLERLETLTSVLRYLCWTPINDNYSAISAWFQHFGAAVSDNLASPY
jgi:hypothetical protein